MESDVVAAPGRVRSEGPQQSRPNLPPLRAPQEEVLSASERELRDWPMVGDTYPSVVRTKAQRQAAALERPMTLVHKERQRGSFFRHPIS